MGHWISVDKELPKSNGDVLVKTDADIIYTGFIADDLSWHIIGAYGTYELKVIGEDPIAWMPIPE